MTPRRSILAAGTFAAIAAAPSPAAADFDITDALYLPIGIDLAGAVNRPLPSGFVLGGEASLVYLTRRLGWFGGYVDVMHDWGAGATRFSLGPEGGWGPFGLDAGFLVEDRGGVLHPGVAGRFLLTASFLSGYARWGYVLGTGSRDFGEFGVQLEFPIPLWQKARHARSEPWQGPPPAQSVQPAPSAPPVPPGQPAQLAPPEAPRQPLPPDAPPAPQPASPQPPPP